ncbi:Thiol-disulfide isomerase or thioredoxin [Niabella drilacis]|uniref:Thiol-disulfide isomerase or thioredoxin n=1 Tax=Niabella drilacis (strain DSM 25811 / CCM 8410 / CCUG 62505 / LMG 26954 / E90) TaxID=1285928 RepID=A0A1G6PN67_NIADE|nr:Thiol-disulfide isomerase or thioredoxin [Niabella drilacis]
MTDTATIQDGRFTFSGTVKGLDLALINNDPKYPIYDETLNIFFVLEPGEQSMIYNYGDLKHAHYLGSKVYDEKAAWDRMKQDVSGQLDVLDRKHDSLVKAIGSGSGNADELRRQLILNDQQRAPVRGKIKQMDLRYISGNNTSGLSLYLLYYQYKTKISPDSVLRFYNRFPETLQKSALGVLCFNYIQRLKKQSSVVSPATPFDKIQLDRPAPDFKILYTKDSILTLNTFKGKVVLIEQWGITCIPCLTYNPHLENLRKKYAGRGFEIISVIDKWDTFHQKLLAYISKARLEKWVHVYNTPQGSADQCIPGGDFEGYACDTIPATILIDQDGVVRYKSTGYQERTQSLEDAIRIALRQK